MKKIMQIITAAVLSVGFIGSVASAQSACNWVFDIQNSGDGNVVTIDCQNVTNVTFSCVNNVVVANISYQEGASGPATVGGQGSNGNTTTGTVTNSNNVSTEVGASCGGTTTTSPTPTPSVKPSPSTTPAAAKPAKLPYTAGASTDSVIAISLAAAAFIVIASRVAVMAYRRVNNK